MGRGVLLHTYITYGERLGATRGLHIHSRDFKVALLVFGRNLAWGGGLGPCLGSPGQRAHRNGALRPGRFRKRGFPEPHSITLVYILLHFDFPGT